MMMSAPRATTTAHSFSASSPRPLPAPQWISLGASKKFSSIKPKQVEVVGSKLAVYRSEESGQLMAQSDACPHRGASLSRSGKVYGDCIRCCYHGHPIHSVYDIREQDGMAWLNHNGRKGVTDELEPPTFPQHADPALRTISYSIANVPVNAVLMTENLLDYEHLANGGVHKVAIVDRETTLDNLQHGSVEYKYKPLSNGRLGLTLRNSYEPTAPFTTSLDFQFTDLKTGKQLPGLYLWFSVQPHTQGTSTIHLKISRGMLRSPVFDWLFKLIDALPLVEDISVVSNCDRREWEHNVLTPSDVFVTQWRRMMLESHGNLLQDLLVD